MSSLQPAAQVQLRTKCRLALASCAASRLPVCVRDKVLAFALDPPRSSKLKVIGLDGTSSDVAVMDAGHTTVQQLKRLISAVTGIRAGSQRLWQPGPLGPQQRKRLEQKS